MADVYAYYYPGWVQNRKCDEWDCLKNASKYFSEHSIRVPSEFYYLDSNPQVIDVQVALAKQHGIDGFIFCFYWDEGTLHMNEAFEYFLESDLDFKFSVMWANRKPHSELPIPERDKRKEFYKPSSERDVATSEDDCARLMGYLQKAFDDPRYAKVDGKPLFSIFSLPDFMPYFCESLDDLPDEHMKELFPGTHFVAIANYVESWIDKVDRLGVDALSSYVLLGDWRGEQVQSYAKQAWRSYCGWLYMKNVAQLPYYPSVTVGWDATPRSDYAYYQKEKPLCYPYSPILVGNTDQEIVKHLKRGLQWAEEEEAPYVVISSWNEWSEGHMLEPDGEHGAKRLKAVGKAVLDWKNKSIE